METISDRNVMKEKRQ